MGCHTWYYVKVDRSIEDATKILIKHLHKEIAEWEQILNDPNDRCREIADDMEVWDNRFFRHKISLIRKLIRAIKKGKRGIRYILNNQPDDDQYHLYEFENGGLYAISKESPHDGFRVSNCPDTKLWSLKGTMDFINNPKNKVYFENHRRKEDVLEAVAKFWDENPKGMINFG